ncbi:MULTISPECIES: DNA polymerase III subunit delta' [Exiguobacterium]|uniref:DNA polymerase III subunit delta n=1 Tax=Exiguobacterium oxidotolerans TaxID=223958 RepID=A0A653I4K0_9BACL|nr:MULTISPECIES: DNA polymerase III subunit delta' [Exiguobacterium]ASI34062.1 DNA polymerase III subunit delta' [Exiguobacterium sp. N4-1P]ASI37054.1 DNA polymerase III subunit delta' [Exiguobacterium sp. N4-1P]VWX33896.1 DNA polymerase III subunit delta [Exiguobacterium oxidotolerans]
MRTFHELEQTQSVISTILQNSLRANRINHAYIFTGDYEPLLLEAAQLFAKSLFCERKDQVEPCNECRSCRRMDSGNLVDYYQIEPDGATIKKEQIQQLMHDLSLRGLEGDRQIYVVTQAHRMTPQAANSLLKFFEEPGEGKVAILLTNQPQLLLPTIRSRGQLLSFRPADRVMIGQVLSDKTSRDAELTQLAARVYSKIDDAEQALIEDWFVNARASVLQLMEELANRPADLPLFVQEKWINQFKNRQDVRIGLELVTCFFEDALHLKLNPSWEIITYTNSRPLLEQMGGKSQATITRWLQAVLAAVKRVEANVNPQLTVERLMFDLQKG